MILSENLRLFLSFITYGVRAALLSFPLLLFHDLCHFVFGTGRAFYLKSYGFFTFDLMHTLILCVYTVILCFNLLCFPSAILFLT